MTAQLALHLHRVTAKIGASIVDFCQLHAGQRFTMGELVDYVTTRVPNCAPDSPSRVLRALRKRGAVNVRLVDRGQSLYEVQRKEAA